MASQSQQSLLLQEEKKHLKKIAEIQKSISEDSDKNLPADQSFDYLELEN